MKARYFASTRERLGKAEEEIFPPAEVTTVGELIGWLAARDEVYAQAFAAPVKIRAALDRVHVKPDAPLGAAREVAFFPPMTGGLALDVRVQRQDFDPAAEVAALSEGRADVGALVSFVGLCRDEGGRLAALEIEHYPGMAEAEILKAVGEAKARWPLKGARVVHRYGLIRPGERIVLVAVAAAHRGPAFAAAEMLMDFLKTRAPFWKRAASGGWIEANDADEAAAARWL